MTLPPEEDNVSEHAEEPEPEAVLERLHRPEPEGDEDQSLDYAGPYPAGEAPAATCDKPVD